MGKELAENFATARYLFQEADDTLGFKLSAVCFSGSDDELKLTATTQPAILTTSIAVLRVLEQETGLQPSFLAGHSLGEYSALVAAGALTFADTVQTVRLRGTFMQDAVPVGTGAMAAMLNIEKDELEDICREAAQGDVVSPANFNSPGQIVIAGSVAAVGRAIEIARERGYRKTMLLPVSAPFHCTLMKPAADRLSDVLDSVAVADLRLPVVANATASPNSDKKDVRSLLVTQVCAAVLWEQSVTEMISQGVDRFVEVGPGKVLSGLVKRISKDVEIMNIEDSSGIKNCNA
jgi:[acyl-carrier-protein] S-malonyltransferase